MHNVEFLPTWYPTLQRRRFAVFVQATVSAAILFGLILTITVRRWEIRSQHAILLQYQQQIHEANKQLGTLNEVTADLHRLRAKERDIARLAVYVDTTRVINALEAAMPAKLALTGLSIDTPDLSANPVPATPTSSTPDRCLNIRLQGVAPSDIEVAILLDKLSKLKVFNDVAMSYIRDRSESGHTMRDFELKFHINLPAAPEVKS